MGIRTRELTPKRVALIRGWDTGEKSATNEEARDGDLFMSALDAVEQWRIDEVIVTRRSPD